MKFSAIAAALALAASANAHCIMGQVSIGGSNQGVGKAIRYPPSNYPVEDVSSGNMACGAGSSTKSDVISAAPGARVGIWFQHLLGGPQGSNDPDNPIASSHKGPIQIYIAKVSSATSSDGASASWTKIASEGLSGGRWAVDTMIAAGGWWYFNLPSCLAPGDYLVRTELLALHSAYNYPGAQFYISCIQLRVTGSGSWTPSGSLRFPGSYSGSDGGIKLNIYGSGGVPNNNNQPYTPPGGSVTQPTCNGNNNPTTTAGTTLRTTTAGQRTTTAGNGGGSGSPLYGQCGGIGWTGPTTCASGRCVANGAYYSQCVP